MPEPLQLVIDRLHARGGGVVRIPTGQHVVDHLVLKSNVTLQGTGKGSVLIQRPGATSHFITAETNALHLGIRDLSLVGQGAGGLDGIHFDNSAGSPTLLASHIIQGVYIYNFGGSGVWMGTYLRQMTLRDIIVYGCNKYGMMLGFSDSIVDGVMVGQSGSHGLFLAGCNATMFSSVKSWYSGRLEPGTGGYGVLARNGAGLQFANLHTQENSGHGFVAWGQSGPMPGLSMTGCTFDSDNAADDGYGGLVLNNVVAANVSCNVRAFPQSIGTPAFAVSLTSNTEDCIVNVTWQDVSGSPIVGDDVADNEVVVRPAPE